MLRLLRKLQSIPAMLRPRNIDPDGIKQEKWIADFSKPKHIRFEIKSESTHDAYLRRLGSLQCLALGIKKTGCIAWITAAGCRYSDLYIQGRINIDSRGGYAAGGVQFRVLDEKTYYSFLISSKAYFRLDVVRNGMPLPLIGWTELPDIAAAELNANHSADFSVVAYGSHIVLLIRGCWAAEVMDSTISEGSVAFAAASYDVSGSASAEFTGAADNYVLSSWPAAPGSPYAAEVFLESLTVDSRSAEVAQIYDKWKGSNEGTAGDGFFIDPKSRFRLAETYTAMGHYNAALVQIRQTWEFPGHKKTQKELLLAGRLAQILGLSAEAESCISACFQANIDSPEGREAITEMAKILYTGERLSELKNYCTEAVKLKSDDPVLFTFKGHAHWDLKEYKDAAACYDTAFDLDKSNGITAKNAGNVYEVMGRKKDALNRFLEAGRAFLESENYNDLGLLVPKLLLLGPANPETHGMAGKWAFGVEDWKMANVEIAAARVLEKRKKKHPDAALAYLQALLLLMDGKRAEAIPLFEEAVSLNPDYALFRFKLAENRYLLGNDPEDPQLRKDLETALALDPGNGWINNFAAQISLDRGNLGAAAEYLKIASSALGDDPEIRMNRADLLSRQGSPDEGLKLLAASTSDGADEDGRYSNCAGNILTAAGRFEEADEYYRKALLAAPDNTEFLSNRASCLIEMGLYGESDTVLAKIFEIAPSASVLEQISYVASRKGEFRRAESACRSALELEPNHVPSLISLGWILVNLARSEEAGEILKKLDKMELGEAASLRKNELSGHLDHLIYLVISCASCGRTWKVPKEMKFVRGIRVNATPPDDLPAGSCTSCGKTWCIGCAKENLDSAGRFICPDCGKTLKLINDGLKKLIYDWAEQDGLTGKKKAVQAKLLPEPPPQKPPDHDADPVKRGRGRPRKNPAAPKTADSGLLPGKRGRPAKTNGPGKTAGSGVKPAKRKRGRPKSKA